jgi:hypothetical protein
LGFIKGLLPLHDVADMAGIERPESLGGIGLEGESEDVTFGKKSDTQVNGLNVLRCSGAQIFFHYQVQRNCTFTHYIFISIS